MNILQSDINPKIFVSTLSSTLFHWLWTVFSDNYHITKKEFIEFRFTANSVNNVQSEKLIELCDLLMEDYQNKSSIRIENDFRNKVKRNVQIFQPRESKTIIDEIDKVLAEYYGFTEEELNFIINYDIKYRMGKELNR